MTPAGTRGPILVDAIPVDVEASVGVQRYLREVLRAVPIDRRGDIVVLSTRKGRPVLNGILGYRRIEVPRRPSGPAERVLIQQAAVPVAAARTGARVVFEPVDYAAIATRAPIVTCVHSSHINALAGSLGGLHQRYHDVLFPRTLRASRRIVAISHYAAAQLRRLDDGQDLVIDVIHHGAGLVDHALAQGGSTGGGGILSVGTHYDHKEGRSLIQAYAHLLDRWPDAPSLTIVGRDHRHNRAALERLCRELRIQDRVRVLGFVDDNALRALWARADLAVLLSQQEGFGLPAAEAMSAGVPLVVSRRGALPEVAEGASVRVDPSNPSAVAEAMHRVLADPRLHAELVQAGRQRADEFTWSRCAASLLETLDLASRESR